MNAYTERLSTHTKLAFSAQATAGAAMLLLTTVYLTKFYVDVVLLPAGMLAIAIVVGRAFDAITDPFMGWISDHTRSRWGRRLPWIAVGVVGTAVMFYVMLNPAPWLAPDNAVWWCSIALVSVFLFLTITSVPRQALAVELTLNQGERQNLFAIVAGFVALGTIIGAVMPNVLGALGVVDPREQMSTQSYLYVTAYLAANLWFLLKIRERPEYIGRGETPFVPGVRRALRNKPFRIMFISHIITAIPIVMPATLLPFYTQYVLQAGIEWVGYFLLAYLVMGLLALPIWAMVAEVKGKLFVWLCAAFVAVTGGLSLFFMGPGNEREVLFIHLYVGTQSAVWLFIGGAMHADVVDYDELHTGARREAQYTALWSIIPKFALIPGAAIPVAALGAVGYVPNEPVQSGEVVFTIKLFYALIPAILNAIGLSIMWWYPLSEARHARIRDGVARHAMGKPATDPITGAELPPPDRRAVDGATAWFLDNFSLRELRRIEAAGTGYLLPRLLATIATYLSLALLAAAGAVIGIDNIAEEPGPLPSLAIIAAGLALTGAMFHLARLRPVLAIVRSPVPLKQIRAHASEVIRSRS